MYILTNPIYDEDYKEGYVFFSYTMSDFISAGIALFQELDSVCGVKLSHCGIISGPEMCIEATTPVVMESNFVQKYVNDPHTVVFLRKPLHWTAGGAKAMIAEVRQDLGLKYSYTGIAGSAILLLLTWGYRFLPFLRYYKNPLNATDEMFCSELVAEGMVAMEGKIGCLKYHPTNIYPVTLFQDNAIWQPWNPQIVDEKMAQGKVVLPVEAV